MSEKTNYPTKKWAEHLNRHFSKADTQIANKHMKRCLISLIIREMQVKTTVRHYLTPVRMAVIKNLQTINAGEGWRKGNTLALLVENCKLVQPLWRAAWAFLKN